MDLRNLSRGKMTLVVIVVLAGILFCSSAVQRYKEKKWEESQYNEAKDLYRIEKYEEALIILYEIPEYTGVAELTAKAEEQLQNRIKMERLQAEYEMQLAEEARRVELMDISEKVPYVGMEETLLSDTLLGTAYYYGANSKNVNREWKVFDIYYYYEGDSIVFTVRVLDGNVYDVHDFRDKPWNRPQVFKNHPYIDHTVQGGKVTEDHPVYKDPYDIELYDDPDDFAYEWEDEFDSYDDAFEYWCEYYGE